MMKDRNTMVVSELIKALSIFPDDAEVYIYNSEIDKPLRICLGYLNSVESDGDDTVILSNTGFWPAVYKDETLAERITIPDD